MLQNVCLKCVKTHEMDVEHAQEPPHDVLMSVRSQMSSNLQVSSVFEN